MQKGIVVFVFANYLDNVLVWNYPMSVDIQPPGMNLYLEYKFVPATLATAVRYPNQLT
jgi:hypothetical protein